jgi:hypothetical protein
VLVVEVLVVDEVLEELVGPSLESSPHAASKSPESKRRERGTRRIEADYRCSDGLRTHAGVESTVEVRPACGSA